MKLLKNRQTLISGILIILIIAHGLFNQAFQIDNATILLVGLLIFLPYIPLLSRIKFGDFEAEISHDDVKKLGEKADEIPSKESNELKKTDELALLAESDPTLALAMARIEIEKRVRTLAEIYLRNIPAHPNLRHLVSQLGNHKIIDPSLVSLLQDVVGVANQAIHGATIKKGDAITLAGYADKAVQELDAIVMNRTLKAKPKPVTSEVVKEYEEAGYLLKTIVPLADEPYMNTYELNQGELDAFLDGYDEYAEFIVSLDRVLLKKKS